ncbi:unnamed protein product [Polarella glacialis]|uniref:Poly(A) RNA polymerase mitochondrial-like central palm domain-containing protein n=1 Tax=Polarella glacialis TaxID=89957 RepID=A0A813HFT1_POLGL|nr:unnamed protein product [Polarella glacialis]
MLVVLPRRARRVLEAALRRQLSGVASKDAPSLVGQSLSWVPPRFSEGPGAWGSSSRRRRAAFPQPSEAGAVTDPALASSPSSPSSSSGGGRAARRSQQLTDEIDALVQKWQASEEQLRRRDEAVQDLRRQLQAAIPGSDLLPFGSVATGLWLKGSDVDLSLQVPGSEGRVETKMVLHRVGAAIHRFSGDKAERRLTARVPVLRWTPSHDKNLPCCDISVNNLLALANSKLICAYIAAEPGLRNLAVAIKTWARARGINDRSRGTLSSFALTLMAVHVLQRQRILPSLQDLAVLRGEPRYEVMGFDCRFCTDPEVISQEAARLGTLHRDDEIRPRGGNLGALLLAFFKYFGSEYRGGVIAVRSSATTEVKASEWASGRFFLVDNPFEPGKDVANVDTGQQTRS